MLITRVQSIFITLVFTQDNAQRINSIDFHRTEDYLITGSDDDSIHVYNTSTGILQDTLFSKKYGVANICFTHAPTCALYATRKVSIAKGEVWHYLNVSIPQTSTEAQAWECMIAAWSVSVHAKAQTGDGLAVHLSRCK